MDEQTKSHILLTALERRYDAVERIRERVYAISIWTLGVFLGLSGLIVQGDLHPGLPAKVFLTAGAVFALAAILFYIRDLEKGFRNQFRVVVQIEELLGFYEEGFFSPGKALYPPEWTRTGTRAAQGRFFTTTYLLLSLGALVLVAAIVLSGVLF